MKVSKGTLRRRFKHLQKNLPDHPSSKAFAALSFKQWVRKHAEDIVKHYEQRAGKAEVTFTDPVMELLA